MKYLHRRDERPLPQRNAFHRDQDHQSLNEKHKLDPRERGKDLKGNQSNRVEVSRLLFLFVIFGLPSQAFTLVTSAMPNTQPSIQLANAENQTFSPVPSSNLNSNNPTSIPTVTVSPSGAPSSSFMPTGAPSTNPTPEPTFEFPIFSKALFTQRFIVGNGREFLPHELGFIMNLYISFTSQFATDKNAESKVTTNCNITKQNGGPKERKRRQLVNKEMKFLRRSLQSFEFVDVDYEMTYESQYINVTEYPKSFQQYVNSNNDKILDFFGGLGANVTQILPAVKLVFQKTDAPSFGPSPYISHMPSFMPSGSPSILPSLTPSARPSLKPTVTTELTEGTEGSGPTTETTVIVVSVVVAISIVIIGLLIFHRKRTFERDQINDTNPGVGPPDGMWNPRVQVNSQQAGLNPNPEKTPNGMVSPSESLISNQSLLSAGNSIGGDSGDEADATQNLADEFDQYKDQNLEKMRADVEGNLTGFDSMMSQALTRALLDEDDDNIDPTELLWGGNVKLSGAEIEASALGEVTDWMKRKENLSVEEKRGFMQETLNKMVARVRQGVLGPDDASRTIHECAALLGLQLATDIPVTTLIVTGMRKTVSAEDMRDTFGQFGKISEAAVAPNKRDFGILRFKTKQSVDLVMEKLRVGEIVVQDVAVHVKVLKPDSPYMNSSEPGNKTDGVTSSDS